MEKPIEHYTVIVSKRATQMLVSHAADVYKRQIKGRVDKVINYARNPEKTTEAARPEQAALHAIDGVVEYAADERKTEKREYVSCLNCKEEDAVSQFMETKRLWKKTDGRLCYHGYQSFKADEVDAATAHQIGVALAKELWGDRFEVVVATHCNRCV